jgi:hypothetical protein
MFAAKAPKARSSVVPKERTFEIPTPKNSSQTSSRDKTSLSTTSFDSQEFSWTSSHDSSDYSELNGGNDIDDEYIYSKNDRTLVAYFGPLPREAEEALNNTGTSIFAFLERLPRIRIIEVLMTVSLLLSEQIHTPTP